MENKEKPKVLKWSLIVAIAILLNLFVNYSLTLILNEPQYNDYCESYTKQPITEYQNCIDNGGKWVDEPRIESETTIYNGYCDLDYTCRKDYETVRLRYEKNIFISLIIFGVVIFILSLLPKLNYVLTVSLGIASVLDFIFASTRYWSAASGILRVIILGLALVILIYVSVKKFSDKK